MPVEVCSGDKPSLHSHARQRWRAACLVNCSSHVADLQDDTTIQTLAPPASDRSKHLLPLHDAARHRYCWPRDCTCFVHVHTVYTARCGVSHFLVLSAPPPLDSSLHPTTHSLLSPALAKPLQKTLLCEYSHRPSALALGGGLASRHQIWA